MIRTLDARNLRHKHRPVLAGIQVTPAARPRVVAAARFAAFRAGRTLLTVDQMDQHLAILQRQLHGRHAPGRFDAEDLRVQVFVSQNRRLSRDRHAGYYPHKVGKTLLEGKIIEGQGDDRKHWTDR
jgi:hypothetical protein